jgi:glycine cleavage system H protein
MRPDDRKYTKTHEWVKLDGETITLGITDHAVQELCSGNEGDLVYCDLPEPGRILEAHETFGEIESVKAVADLNTPVAGTVLEVNVQIEEHLEILADDPFGRGWLLRLDAKARCIDSPELIDAAAYEEIVASAEH